MIGSVDRERRGGHGLVGFSPPGRTLRAVDRSDLPSPGPSDGAAKLSLAGLRARHFPALRKFLDFWTRELDGEPHSVVVAHARLVEPSEFRRAHGEFPPH